MGFVAAKCTECGADIEVDDTKEAGICKYCGTAFINEKAINNYNTYITNNYTTTNNFAGANVTIQQNTINVDGLLRIAKKELLAKHYCSNDLIDALKDIIVQSMDGEKQILDLFNEVGMYDLAEKAIEENDYSIIDLNMIKLLEKYDFDNVVGWILEWNWGNDFIPKSAMLGINILRLAKAEDKSKYEKEVYSYFVTHGPRCNAYKEYLSAVPKEYINNNKFIQDLILSSLEYIQSWQTDYREDKVKVLTEMLPESRRSEIYKPQQSGGCYVATCVYGSYDCPQVWTLRRFRDYSLKQKWLGRIFIKAYYAIGPKVVRQYGDKVWFNNFWRFYLDKIVADLNRIGVKDTYYKDAIN